MTSKTSAKQARKSKTDYIQISPVLQLSFLVANLSVWLVSAGSFALSYLQNDVYDYPGGWLFHASLWLHPILFFLVGLSYSWKRYDTLLHRLFIAEFLATIGSLVYGIMYGMASIVRYKLNMHNLEPASAGLLGAYGYEWIMMLLGLALFVLWVGLLDKKKGEK